MLVSILETGSAAQQDRVLNSLLQFLYDNHRHPPATYKIQHLMMLK